MGGGIFDVLHFAIDGVNDQTNVVANNLANANTPDFKASDVSFADSLASAIASPGEATASEATTPSTTPAGTNGNNVSLSDNLVDLEKDALSFQQLSESLNAQFRLIAGASGGSFT